MNFGDKLYNLRRQKGLSQEELGEKLNVTRQTVSKWELNQSKPDTDKMKEISDLFSVSIDDLTNDSVTIQRKDNNASVEDSQPRRWLLVVLILLAIAISIVLINKIVMDKKAAKGEENNYGIFDKIFNDTNSEINKSSFNNDFEMYKGTKYGSSVSSLFDNVITNNKKNKDKLVTVVYEETETTDPDKIKDLKKSFDKWSEYEVSIDYDDEGYVNKVTVESYNDGDGTISDNNFSGNSDSDLTDINTDDFEKKAFNSQATFRSGSKSGFFVKSMIDYVVSNNSTNVEHQLFVSYNGTTVSDTSGLNSLKTKFDDFTDYEVTVSYAADGYANGFNVK